MASANGKFACDFFVFKLIFTFAIYLHLVLLFKPAQPIVRPAFLGSILESIFLTDHTTTTTPPPKSVSGIIGQAFGDAGKGLDRGIDKAFDDVGVGVGRKLGNALGF